MTTTSSKNQPAFLTGNLLRWIGIVIAVLGLGVATYMSWAELTGNETACPGASAESLEAGPNSITVNCGFVQNSVYAHVAGIPVAVLGFVGYTAILAAWFLERRSKLLAEYGALIVFGLAFFGFLFSAYLTYIEYFVIYSVCSWCLTSAALMTLVFIVASLRLYGHMTKPAV